MIKRLVLLNLLLALLLIPALSAYAASSDTEMILEQIRQLREDMNKRFEQVDRRFEQVDKGMEFLQGLLIALLAIVVGGTGYNIYQGMKIPKDLDIFLAKVQRLEIALREIASKDPQTLEHLKRLGLL